MSILQRITSETLWKSTSKLQLACRAHTKNEWSFTGESGGRTESHSISPICCTIRSVWREHNKRDFGRFSVVILVIEFSSLPVCLNTDLDFPGILDYWVRSANYHFRRVSWLSMLPTLTSVTPLVWKRSLHWAKITSIARRWNLLYQTRCGR